MIYGGYGVRGVNGKGSNSLCVFSLLFFPFFLLFFFFLYINTFDILAILHRYFDKILLKCERNYRHRYFPILSSILSILVRYVHGYVPKYPWFEKTEISSIFRRYYRYFRLCFYPTNLPIEQVVIFFIGKGFLKCTIQCNPNHFGWIGQVSQQTH